MARLLSLYFCLDTKLSSHDKEIAEEYLRSICIDYGTLIYRQGPKIEIHFEDGSLKTWITFSGLLMVAIGEYGSLRSGIDQIIDDGKYLQKLIVSSLIKDGLPKDKIVEAKKLNSLPEKIRRLLKKIEKYENNTGSLTSDERKMELEKIIIAVASIGYEIDNEEEYAAFLGKLSEIYHPKKNRLFSEYNRFFIPRNEKPRLRFPYK